LAREGERGIGVRLHILQHVPFEDEGSVRLWARLRRHTCTRTRLYASDPYPSQREFDALVVTGGPMNVYEYDRIYGAATTVYFPLVTPSATTSDTFLPAATADPFESGDSRISLGGGDFAPTNSLPAKVDEWLYKIDLLAGETAAEDVWIILHDDDATAYRDCAIHIRTKIQTGQITANADNIATNTDALVLVKNGSGKAINATGSVAISGDVTAANITLSNDLTIANDLTIGNNLSVGGDLVVASDISVTGSINATDIAGVLVSMVLVLNIGARLITYTRGGEQ
jgi:acetyltransferase-like isoleucine patch superfamily enzyme